MRGTHPNICVATLTCVVWELLEGAHHGTCVASLCECSLQQQLINTGVRARARWAGGLRGGAVVELEAAEQSWYGVAPGCAVRYIRGCTTCDLCVIFHCRVHITARRGHSALSAQSCEPSAQPRTLLEMLVCFESRVNNGCSGGHWKTSAATASAGCGMVVQWTCQWRIE